MPKTYLAIIVFLLCGLAGAEQYHTQKFSVNGLSWQLTLPVGYQLELLAEMEKPRMMVFANDDTLLIGSLTENVYRVPPPYTKAEIFAKLWGNNNHGIAIRDNKVWIARPNGVYQAPYPSPNTIYTLKDFNQMADLPAKTGGHFSRTIKVGPDNEIYVSLGISGNCSDEYIGADYDFEHRRGGIVKLRDNTKLIKSGIAQWEIYTSGLRNPIGFDWHPNTDVMYASNNGPDHLGYDHPAEYFSKILPGSFHGMPWFWFDGNKMVHDQCISSKPPRTDAISPSVTFPARNAPMDVAFVPPGALNKNWQNNAVVALHGSWATQPRGDLFGNRATRRPPWIALVYFDKGKAIKTHPLIEGFQNDNGKRLARPLGLAFGSDGALYFTSDGGEVQGLFRINKTTMIQQDL